MIREWAVRLHIRHIRAHFRARRQDRILEVGCNQGLLLDALGTSGASTYGIDLDPAVVSRANANGHNVLVCNAEDLAFPDRSFDALISVHTIEHIGDLSRAMVEFCRVLKPGGRLVLVYPYEPVVGITCMPFCPLSQNGNVHLRAVRPRDLAAIAGGDRLDLAPVYSGMYFALTPNYISVFRKRTG